MDAGRAGLLKTRALQLALFKSANFSSIATDARGVIQIFNVGCERMLGYTAAEVVNTITPADISDPGDLIMRAQALSAELATPIAPGFEALVLKASHGIEDLYELTYIRKDGSRFAAMVSVTAVRDDQDAIIGYLLIGTDNTARKQIEDERRRLDQQLRAQKAELERASRTKSEFLANMSHELRTPLNAIMGFSEVLAEGLMGDLTDHQRALVGNIFNSGEHLLALINDILDLSNVEAGKMELYLERVPLSPLFQTSLSIVKEKAAARRIELTFSGAEDLGAIEADGRKVKQIVDNLLSNAVKFTQDGGTVRLSASRVLRADVGQPCASWPHRTFPLAHSGFAEFVKITVTDSGNGISPEGLLALFQPFGQIDSGLARRFDGTGLGLVLVKVLAELHGGSVCAESAVGKGSNFTVWLPVRAAAEALAAAAKAPSLPCADTPAAIPIALVVEQDRQSAELIRLQLQAHGFGVLHAVSAETALALAAAHTLALITTDIMLPGMDGWEFLGRIKQVPELVHIPVVIISIVADRGRALALGTAAVMQKPMARQELSNALRDLGLLSAGRSGRRASA